MSIRVLGGGAGGGTTDISVLSVRSITTAGGTTAGSPSEHAIEFTGTTTQTYTLPPCVNGKQILITNSSTGAITINRDGSDTILGGTAAIILAAGDGVILVGFGAGPGNWKVF